MVNKLVKLTLIILAIALIPFGSGCASSGGHSTHQSSENSFENLVNKDKTSLIKLARTRSDKFEYGNALGSVIFPIYFPLVLPDEFELKRADIQLAKPNRKDMKNLEGETGSLVVEYKRNQDTITVYQGDIPPSRSEITFLDKNLQLGDDKPYAYYQKRADGYDYIGWRESFNNFPTGFDPPKNDVANGGEYAFYNNNIQYLIKAKGLEYDELIGMAKSMTIYDDEWTETDKNTDLGMWQTEKVPWDNKKYQDWQNWTPALANYSYPDHQDQP